VAEIKEKIQIYVLRYSANRLNRTTFGTDVLLQQTGELIRQSTLSTFVRHWVKVMVFNPTFNNIIVISWRSVLLVEEIGVPGENHRAVASH